MKKKKLRVRLRGQADSQVELAATVWNPTFQNNLSENQIPSRQPNEVETRIQNLLRVEESHTFEATVSDRFVKESDEFGSGIEDKEDVYDQLVTIFTGLEPMEFDYGDTVTNKQGFISELSFEERAQQDNSVFRIDFTVLVGEPMGSN